MQSLSPVSLQQPLNLAKSPLLQPDKAVSDQEVVKSDPLAQKKASRHWSVVVASMGTVTGVVAAAVAAFFSIYEIAAAGVVLAVTNGIAARFLKKFTPLRSIEAMVKALSERVQVLQKTVMTLEEVNKELEDHKQHLNTLAEEQKQLHIQLQAKYDQKIEELKQVREQLSGRSLELQQQLQDHQKVVEQLGDFEKQAGEFVGSNKEYTERLSRLRVELQQAKDLQGQYQVSAQSLEEENKGLARQVVRLESKIAGMGEQMQALQEVHQEMQRERDLLKGQISDLQSSQEKAEKESSQLESATNNLQQMADRVEKVNEDLAANHQVMQHKDQLGALFEKIAKQEREKEKAM